MNLFLYNSTYEVWHCTAPCCQYTVSPTALITHLRTRHRPHPSAATPAPQQGALTTMRQRPPWVDPEQEIYRVPPANSPLIPGLPVYRDYSCANCGCICRPQTLCRIIAASDISIKKRGVDQAGNLQRRARLLFGTVLQIEW